MLARPARPLAAVLAVLGLMAAAPRASAETINLTLNDSGTSVTYKPNGGSSTTVNGGPFHWTQSTPLNTNYATAVTTYCIDLDQTVSKGGTYTYTVQTDLKLAPTIGTAAKAAVITELFDRYYNTSLTSAASAAAFQLALWELVYDGATSKSLSAGRIQGSNSLASSMLGSLGGAYSTHDLAGYHLVALVSGTKQDQIMVVKDSTPPPSAVPAPPGVVLAGIGFGSLLLGRLRFRKV
ncbi:Cys-Gln thioester bond-forming surface protein [Gemmata sp. JC717]|uniref:Cys-Gln thioester bond-forming surface protein n=1 Tax=Gemmata algarum TaxID=2975278 RepID=UPI0021BAE5ED|nr:Cys-Gln thioester bond-forming surface protein [Gemmata algarum]MDY3556424.1 Cys-Gln thioester bond-forming surface protein [Gemmata algarum]